MTNVTDYSDLVTDAHRVLDMASNGGTPYDTLELSIGQDADVSLGIRTYYGGDGTSFDVWHGRTRVYTLLGKGGAHVDLDALRADLSPTGRLAPLIDRIAAGLDSEWDGSNMRGTMTDDASTAEDELDDVIERIAHEWVDDRWTTWDVYDYLHACKHEIDGTMTDEELSKWAANVERVAGRDCVRIDGDVLEWATEVRNEKRDAA